MFENLKIEDVADVTKLAGFEFSKYIKYNDTGEIIALRAINIRNNTLDLSDIKRIDKDVSENLQRSKLFKNDIILTYTGNGYGAVTIIDEDNKYHLAPNICKITPKNINPYYLFKYITTSTFQQEISNNIGGSGQPTIPMKTIRVLPIKVPSRKMQDKIVKVLYDIDKKIKLNNEINNNLQELILTLYKKFIDDNSEAEEVTLEDCVKKIGTGADAIQRAPIVDYDTGIRCIRVGDMTNNRKCYEWGFAKMTDKDFNNYKLYIGDIVITRTAVNGLSYLIEDSMNIVCNNGLIRLKVNEKYNPLYIYLTMKTKDFYNYIHRIDSETSVRPNMKVDYLTSYKIKKISLEKQNQFCDMIKSMRQRQKEIEYENNNLTQLRDTLLPKLMNGEIDLDNIEI